MEHKFFEIIPNNANIDFLGRTKFFFTFSGILILASLIALFSRGLQYGVDFEGGTQLQVRFHSPTSAADVRRALSKVQLSEAMVQEVGDNKGLEFIIRVPTAEIDLVKYKPRIDAALKDAKIRYSEDRIYVSYTDSKDPNIVKEALNGLGVEELTTESVTPFGKATDHEYLVQFSGMASRIVRVLKESYGAQKFEVLQTDQVGPKVGKELRWQAIGAVLISMVLILIYVWFRFEFDFAVGAVVALFHDPIVILGVFAFFKLQFDLSVVAAVLTIVGFSINDTIVVFDRIRENMTKMRSSDLKQIMNESVNQTLSRTILTSGTVLMASLALVIFGGPITLNFSLAFSIGVIVGTYSSIGVASALTLMLHNYRLKNTKRLAA